MSQQGPELPIVSIARALFFYCFSIVPALADFLKPAQSLAL
jgi:hypothetical protein